MANDEIKEESGFKPIRAPMCRKPTAYDWGGRAAQNTDRGKIQINGRGFAFHHHAGIPPEGGILITPFEEKTIVHRIIFY